MMSCVFKERNPSLILCCNSWQTDRNTVKTSNTEFLYLPISWTFLWNTDLMECVIDMLLLSHFQRTSSKLLADEIGREKNDFRARHLCTNHSMAKKSDIYLVLLCDSCL
jgi:hypothetical protein